MLPPKKKADRTTDESNAGKDSPVKTGVKTEKSDLANNDFDDSSKSQVKTEESLNGKKIPATHSPSKFSYVSMKSKDSATPASSPSRKRSIPPDGSPKRRKKSTTKDADKHPKLDFFKNVKVEKAQKPKAEK
ncbi:unnamed protein product [[Candida] boidinii]|nr:unnamed protein product [[Candida] boidinii]